MSAGQGGHSRSRRPLERDDVELRPCCLFDQVKLQAGDRPGIGSRHRHLAGVLLGVFDKLLEVLPGRVRLHTDSARIEIEGDERFKCLITEIQRAEKLVDVDG